MQNSILSILKEDNYLLQNEVSKDEAMEAVRVLIRYIGDNPDREGLIDTPERVVKSYDELFKGYKMQASEILKKTFSSDNEEMVILKNIEFYSTCEHHMLPFHGRCHIGYLPKGKVLGISKLARVMEVYTRRLQIQEDLCKQIADAILNEVSAGGVAVRMEAKHMCMNCRGVNKQDSLMISSVYLGEFKYDSQLKNEFLQALKD